MLVVVASHQDRAARALVARWAREAARLLAPEDLSVAGWRYPVGARGACTAVVGGRVVDVGDITGVLTRLPSVSEGDLAHITPHDRSYVAAEMTALLVSWLSGLKCPVLNRPTPLCLSGPNWGPEQWTHVAAQAGIRVRPVRRRVGPPGHVPPERLDRRPVSVTVVGNRCFGATTKTLAVRARRLADVAKVDLLAVRFSRPEEGSLFLGADPCPDVSTDEVADAILEHLRAGR